MSQPEARLSRKIQAHLRERGAFCFKVHGGPTMAAGLPDIIACYQGLFVGFEVKMPAGKTSQIQEHVHSKIRDAAGYAFVVRSLGDVDAALKTIDEDSAAILSESI